MNQTIVLASASPRRRELLDQISIPHRVFSVDIDESPLAHETPLELVSRLAKQKAHAAQLALKVDLERASEQQLAVSNEIILAADTIIEFEGVALGKPKDAQDSINTLLLLSNNTHEVRTSFCIRRGNDEYSETVTSIIQFGSISEKEAQVYWDSGEPVDKAGSYGIQGRGAIFVKKITGSYSAVVGLPLFECRNALLQFGVT